MQPLGCYYFLAKLTILSFFDQKWIRVIAAYLALFGVTTYASTVIERGWEAANSQFLVAATAWKVPFAGGVGLAFAALIAFVIASICAAYVESDQPRMLPAIAVVTGVAVAYSWFVPGDAIVAKTWPIAIAAASWGVSSFFRSGALVGSLAGTFTVGFWAVFLGPDTIRLWSNLEAVQAHYQQSGNLMSIGGAGLIDGLIYIPAVAVGVAAYAIAVGLIVLQLKHHLVQLIGRWKNRDPDDD